MKKLLAISGGVDSMVLLDLFKNDPEVIIAHFNHGTRPSADADQFFVAKTAEKYHLPFFATKQNLGSNISESKAREFRYRFLQKIATEQNAVIYTAHHIDDLIESITINFLRGTGWRGLTPFSNPNLRRPFLDPSLLPPNHFSQPFFTRNDILRYAAKHQINYRHDPTNSEDFYLRNRIRPLILDLSTNAKKQLFTLYNSQNSIRKSIDFILENILPTNGIYQRAWFRSNPDPVLLELLRCATKSANLSLTRPKLQDFLHAIRNYPPEKSFNLPNNQLVKLHKTYFQLPA